MIRDIVGHETLMTNKLKKEIALIRMAKLNAKTSNTTNKKTAIKTIYLTKIYSTGVFTLCPCYVKIKGLRMSRLPERGSL
jgi:hypothetical protein